ncbi:hypothetical protein [Aquiflexum sp.]|uniref:hypothetical protein n=1 Tax=Aquiflexum sp. TaxID=1872584 RepID=UPI00359454A6
MKKILLALYILLLSLPGFSQDIIEWDQQYQVKMEDFQSKRSKIDGEVILIQTSAKMDFAFAMSNYEFMLTKNFNSKVTNTFSPKSAVLIAPDLETATKLVKFAQYQFDLNELYTRQFRKMLYENKGAFSSITYINPLFENVQNELTERYSEAAEITNLGLEQEVLLKLHLEVLDEIAELKDFCKTCKPPKVKKK